MSSVASEEFSIAVHFDDVATRFSTFVYPRRCLPRVVFLKDRHFATYHQFGKVFCISVEILLLLPTFGAHPFTDLVVSYCVFIQQGWDHCSYFPVVQDLGW